MTVLRRKAVITEVLPLRKGTDRWGNKVSLVPQVRAVDETGHEHLLMGLNRPKDVVEGDKGVVEYRRGPSYGLWFFEKEI